MDKIWGFLWIRLSLYKREDYDIGRNVLERLEILRERERLEILRERERIMVLAGMSWKRLEILRERERERERGL